MKRPINPKHLKKKREYQGLTDENVEQSFRFLKKLLRSSRSYKTSEKIRYSIKSVKFRLLKQKKEKRIKRQIINENK